MKKEGKKEHRILKGILKFFLTIIIIIVLFVVGFVGYSTYKNGWGWVGLIKTAVGSEVASVEELDEFQVLILGISEDISAALTDTIMVGAYNPKTQKATLLSIPRDTFVGNSKLRADSYDKINAIYQKGGAEGVLEKVNKLTGLNIKNYIVISNKALVELVDEIGGVKFDVPINMDYDSRAQNLHIHLKKGLQTLDGKEAEGLVRFRKNNNYTTYSSDYGNDDFGRMRTQREFLKEVAKQTFKAKNITKIGHLFDILKRNVKTNIKDWNAVKEYIPYAVEFNTEDLQMDSIPGDSARVPAGTGLWFFLADESKTLEMVEELFTNQNTEDEEDESNTIDDTNTANTNNSGKEANTNTNTNSNSSSSKNNSSTQKDNKAIKIELLNGSGDKTILTKVTNLLKKEGYTVYKTGTTSTTHITTIINRKKVSEGNTKKVKTLLGTGVISSSNKSSNVDLTIIIGKDYK